MFDWYKGKIGMLIELKEFVCYLGIEEKVLVVLKEWRMDKFKNGKIIV